MLNLSKINPELLKGTRSEWLDQIDHDPAEFLPGRYISTLDWTKKCVHDEGDGNIYAYAVVDNDRPDSARAILQLSHARPNSDSPWLKVLSIHLEPNLDISRNDEDISLIAEISIVALKGCLDLTFQEYPSNTLKLYAGTPLSLEFLRGLSQPLKEFGIGISTHGNWLVLSGLNDV
uniref:Uncharacterized protein n=1 Tax=Candidatus Kentrum sp. TUN TaxID=2126343 RepID=A0A450ZV05_9GAMM|nr:MAG: hypothetical protein BECKTUN1418F_GA0071002_112312 [Candidatus Kentron sp. TUN]VFK64951.1 MAG: hypothetical protein BECKTUN1418D_GA0071000_13021 [Candidatus Kentron sp. TUN]VFK65996.1 MAG: hypothetical protein BECKTUN1418E_GA0071001_111812 [Candidatus Kentron sp. TUN]